MPNVTIYTTASCYFCHVAKNLLRRKNIAFTEIDVSGDWGLRRDMMKLANGRHAVPQIFVGSTHVGGSHELQALESQGGLDRLLAA